MKFAIKFVKSFSFTEVFFLLFILIAAACTTVPLTGRNRINFIPESTIMNISLQEYQKFLKENELSKNVKQIEMVKRVGKNIQKAVEQYFFERNMTNQINDYKWEFNLIEGRDKNAWCMPGGQVVIYEGILPIAKNDNGLAVVMGHEIAHAVAKHGNERMSHSLLIQSGGALLSAVTYKKSVLYKQIFMTTYGIGTQLGFILPYSRIHEKEADYLGLIFMTIAGYDPNKAIKFWERMKQDSSSSNKIPEFLSTHPSGATRISEIKNAIPEVLRKYRR